MFQSSLNSRTPSPWVSRSLALNRKTNPPILNSILAYISDAEHIASNAYSSRGAIHPHWQEIERSLPLSCLRERNVWSKAKCVKCKYKSLHSGNTFPILSGSIAGLWLGDANLPNRWHVVPTYVEKTCFWKSKWAGATWSMQGGAECHPSYSQRYQGWGSQWKLREIYPRCSLKEGTSCVITLLKKVETLGIFQLAKTFLKIMFD